MTHREGFQPFEHATFHISGIRKENVLSGSPRLKLFADLRTGETQGDVGQTIVDYLNLLSKSDAKRGDVQRSVQGITRELLIATHAEPLPDNVLLVPVLRAGLGMWGAANSFFPNAETAFLMGQKEKGTDKASIIWPKKNELEGKRIVVLDPIIASGDTLLKVCAELGDNPITVVSCYGAPQGVERVLEKTQNVDLIVGCMAESMGADGYLIPPTHGDMGDKLFGPVQEDHN